MIRFQIPKSQQQCCYQNKGFTFNYFEESVQLAHTVFILRGYLCSIVLSENDLDLLHTKTQGHNNRLTLDSLCTLLYSFGNYRNTMEAFCSLLTLKFSSVDNDSTQNGLQLLYRYTGEWAFCLTYQHIQPFKLSISKCFTFSLTACMEVHILTQP